MVMAQPPSLIIPGTLYLLLAGRRKNKKLPKVFYALKQLIFIPESKLAFPPLNYNSITIALAKSPCVEIIPNFPVRSSSLRRSAWVSTTKNTKEKRRIRRKAIIAGAFFPLLCDYKLYSIALKNLANVSWP
jgi:hypothetical protein